MFCNIIKDFILSFDHFLLNKDEFLKILMTQKVWTVVFPRNFASQVTVSI